jgi:hypothetical protein
MHKGNDELIKRSIIMTIRNISNAIVILFFFLFISSCSNTRILYNNSDWLILNKFDTYFDLNNTQRLDLKVSITEFLNWHRESELSLLIVSLEELKSRYLRGMREEDFDWINDQYNIARKRILHYIEPALTTFLLTLEEKQVRHMEQKFIERDDWLAKQGRMTDSQVYEETRKWFFDKIENWLGSLNSDQITSISSLIQIDRNWVAIKLKNRNDFQEYFGSLLRSKENLPEGLHNLFYQPQHYSDYFFMQQKKNKKKEWEDILLEVDRITLPHQRKEAANELQRYIDDFLLLSQESTS